MFLELLAMGGGATGGTGTGSPAGVPTIADADVATLRGGFCTYDIPSQVGESAAIQVTWSINNPNATDFETRLFESGVLVGTVDNATTEWSLDVGGVVEGGPYNSYYKDWQFRIDVVRKVDGVAVSSQTTRVLSIAYGTCSEGAHG